MNGGESCELDVIRWIRAITPAAENVPIGIGDDCAAVLLESKRCLFKIDQVAEGVHFLRPDASPEQIGHKALARPLSDVAAMAGVPRAAVISALLPPDFGVEENRRMYAAMLRLAGQFQTSIVGGDIACGRGGLVISVAIIGESNARGDVKRSGARPGDAIFVTGELGGSMLGRHLSFIPRVNEALELAEAVALSAMIDISDGLTADLQHILDESNAGAILRADDVPISDAARSLSAGKDTSPLDHALGDGEDYELLFTVAADAAGRVPRVLASGVITRRIGEIISGRGIQLEDASGRRPIQPRGWTYKLRG